MLSFVTVWPLPVPRLDHDDEIPLDCSTLGQPMVLEKHLISLRFDNFAQVHETPSVSWGNIREFLL